MAKSITSAPTQIDYVPFTLGHPAREAIYLRLKYQSGLSSYAEYAPHVNLGDQSVSMLLNEIKLHALNCTHKVIQQLLDDTHYQNDPRFISFQNHQWIKDFSPSQIITSKYVKIKINPETRPELWNFPKDTILRLDANGSFTIETFKKFFQRIPKNLVKQIEYIEDPILELDWSEIPLPLAQDFLRPHVPKVSAQIYKPSRDCFEQLLPQTKTIFSNYQGSWLSDWHAYQELARQGDLSVPHGLVTPCISTCIDGLDEKISIFMEVDGAPQTFTVRPEVIANQYQKLSRLNWRPICLL